MAAVTTRDPTLRVLTAEQVRRFRVDGFLKLEGLIAGDELARLREVCVGTEDRPRSGLVGQGSDDPRFAYHADERYRRMWSNVFDLRLELAEVQRLVHRLADVARDLVDEDVRVFWDKTFVKPPITEGTRESVWHQDFPYNPIDRRGMLTVWVALEDVPVESGALRFVPGSHRLGPLGRLDLVGDDIGVDGLLRPEDRSLVGDPVAVPLRAGDATVHDALTLHGAGPNTTNRPRRAWTVVYLPASTRYTGGPHPQAGINELELVPFSTFDHDRFLIPDEWGPVPLSHQGADNR